MRNKGPVDLTGIGFKIDKLVPGTQGHPKCYAHSLQSCKGDISAEHYISENLLAQIGSLSVNGLPWLDGRVTSITPSTLTANCLCKYHNSFLSPLDSLAGRVFQNFSQLADRSSPKVIIWGPSLELWFLKTLCGLVGARVVKDGQGRIIQPRSLPKLWIEVLFGKISFPDGLGLYVFLKPGDRLEFEKKLVLETLLLDDNLEGVGISLGGLRFILTMAEPARAFNMKHPDAKHILYHPKGFNFDGVKDRIRIVWS